MSPKKRVRLSAAYLIGFLVIQAPASAEVWVNGQLVEGYQLQQLTLAAGEIIPAGRYWLKANGNWGYEGNSQVQGNLYGSSGTSGGSGLTYSDYDPSRGGSSISRYSDGCMIASIPGYSFNTCDP
jgi:hypothetical protein